MIKNGSVSALASGNIHTVLIERTCPRCGALFGAYERQIVCNKCRKPQNLKGHVERHMGPLTPREKQIVVMVGEAKLNKEIAYELRLQYSSVREYMNRIFHKLGVHNRTEVCCLYWKGKIRRRARKEGLQSA